MKQGLGLGWGPGQGTGGGPELGPGSGHSLGPRRELEPIWEAGRGQVGGQGQNRGWDKGPGQGLSHGPGQGRTGQRGRSLRLTRGSSPPPGVASGVLAGLGPEVEPAGARPGDWVGVQAWATPGCTGRAITRPRGCGITRPDARLYDAPPSD